MWGEMMAPYPMLYKCSVVPFWFSLSLFLATNALEYVKRFAMDLSWC